jgi:hypothetical protein
MINYNLLKNICNNILQKYYPLNYHFENIYNLSHFKIISQNWNQYLPFHFNLEGNIIDGEYRNYKIINIITKTNEKYTYKKFIELTVSILPNYYNPYIDRNKFLILLYVYNNIHFVNIKNMIIKKKDEIINIPIKYTNKPNYHIEWNISLKSGKINKKNHFYFSSFNVYQNQKELKKEMMQLFINRDKYKSIHFHLDNNGGGDIVPAHLILRCLTGKKEKWMKNIKKYLHNKKIVEWNCWKEEDKNSPNYQAVKYLDLDFIPDYQTKYNGKIYLYMNSSNGSAAWFFITYLIYAFSNNIKRFYKKCYGKILKFGTIDKNSNLVLRGISGTTSGDGNSKNIQYKNIMIECPTEQFISCSIKDKDWNRYWIQSKKKT